MRSACALASTTMEPAEEFDHYVHEALEQPLRARSLGTFQVNVGLRCNLACRHCHVESSPKRDEEMSWETMMAVLNAARSAGAHTLDITGGAPEMHPRIEPFVESAQAQGLKVIVRTNLTIMLRRGYQHFPVFFAGHGIRLVASLPCYLPTNVDRQRGRHVYRDSIAAIQRLNALGYGTDADKVLDLVYNPLGPALPPKQEALEEAYRRALGDEFGIHFNHLYTITNMAIGRFLNDLARFGDAERYQQLLRDTFNPATLDDLMCRDQVHVGWDGTLYDCDFNFALGLSASRGQTIYGFDPDTFLRRRIATGNHCFACTAGCGSSCGGALT